MPRLGFVMEQTQGHVTHYKHLRATIDADASVSAVWYPVDFAPHGGLETLPLLRSNWSTRASWRVWRTLKHDRAVTRYDALFFHTQLTALLCLPLMRRVPSVVSMDATPINYDTVGPAYDHERGGEVVEGLKRAVNARSFHSARALVTWSDWARQSLVHDYGVPEERTHVIPPGVDLIEWSISNNRDGNAIVTGDRPFRLLFVGGNFERKGGPLLLEVFRRHLSDTCELHLVTKGDVKEESRIHVYRGFGPNEPGLRAVYEQCDAMVLPTQADCFSLASIEAMACGLPTISCPVGGIPEIISHGESGFLIPPGDGRALLETIQVLVKDPTQAVSMGLAGRKIVEERFDASTNARRILDLLIQVIAQQERVERGGCMS